MGPQLSAGVRNEAGEFFIGGLSTGAYHFAVTSSLGEVFHGDVLTLAESSTLMMTLGENTQIGTFQYPSTFPDVPAEWEFAREVEWLVAEGITTGYPDGTFQPWNSVNRDAMAAFLYRLAGEPQVDLPPESPFTDVDPGDMFYKEIVWLESTGISTGWDMGDGTAQFRALLPVNRDAMAAFLHRFAGPTGEQPTESPFVDITRKHGVLRRDPLACVHRHTYRMGHGGRHRRIPSRRADCPGCHGGLPVPVRGAFRPGMILVRN